MARKVFISVLGTGFYGSCQYSKDEFTSDNTRFIQKATLEYIGASGWSKDSAAYIMLTPSARKINWEEPANGIRQNRILDKDEEYHGLKTEIDSLSLPFSIEDVSIPNGKNEDEMWKIFETLYDKIEDEDELYIDLTHSFRYIPMLVMVFSNYVKFLKHAKVVHISYGNYEERDENNIAPIIDLLPLSALQDWTAAADQYLTSGNVEKLNALYLPILKSRLRDTRGRDQDATMLRGFLVHFDNLIKDRLTCQGKKIIESKELCQVIKDLQTLKSIPIPEPFKPILDEISKSLSDFDVNANVTNGFRAAQWSFDNGLYQQSVTLLQETIVCYVCSCENLDWSNLTIRETVSSAFAIASMNIPENNWILRGNTDDEKVSNKELINRLIANKQLLTLKDNYAYLSEIRNQYNHAGMLAEAKFSSKVMIDKVKEILKRIDDKISTPCSSI